MKKTLALLFIITISFQSFAQCWTQIAAGEFHTVAIKSDGTLWAWGLNDKGQLGDGTTVNKNVPTQIGTDADWAVIDAAGANTLALKNNGTLWSFGSNTSGQIGDGNFGSGVFNTLPAQIGTDTDWVKIVAVKAFAIKNDGTLWGWGNNVDGQLGTGDMISHYTPFQIGIDTDWQDISAGANPTLALKSNHTVWGWGRNITGCLAIGAVNELVLTPTQTGNHTSDWKSISNGACCFSKMTKIDNSLWGMGSNTYGNLGNGGTEDVNVPTEIDDNNWIDISTSNHSCGIKNDGTLWVWGNNFQGQLGDGTTVNKNVPTQIGQNTTWQSVKTGLTHTVAISTDGTLYSWGWNNYGQLGDGTLVNKNTITQIGTPCALKINNFSILRQIYLYPNPTNSDTVCSYSLNENAEVEISLINYLGERILLSVQKGLVGRNEIHLDLTKYESGVYLLKIKCSDTAQIIKVIKK